MKNLKTDTGSVKIIPLGGLDRIGRNITAFEYGDSIIVLDCGISFPDENMPGIDKVIPDISYLLKNKDKVKGIVITHGHEDHIGALPYILPQLNVPIYATELTMGLINHKLEEAHVHKVKKKIVTHGQCVRLGDFRVEFIKTNHSIAQASALAIYSPAGTIFHTGDFKVDYTPLFGDAIDLQRFGEIGREGVLALLCDSTNATRPGFTPSETKVARTFDNLFAENKGHRIVVATFASNVDRVQQIIYTAQKFGRKVILQGRSMLNVIEIASKMGYMKLPPDILIDVDEMNRYADEKLVFITTGSQGESLAALTKMADGTHKKVSIKPKDVIIFSSSPIPGNEKAIYNVINDLSVRGANIIIQDTHVSGHACQEEIKLIYNLIKPQYAIPVHGEYRHLSAQAQLAKELRVDPKNIFVLNSGDVLELSHEHGSVVGHVPARGILVDGLGIDDVGTTVLQDRQSLSENGVVIVVASFEKGTAQIITGPDIISRGFSFGANAEKLLSNARDVVLSSLKKCSENNINNQNKIKNILKEDLNAYFWSSTQRNPVILSVFNEI